MMKLSSSKQTDLGVALGWLLFAMSCSRADRATLQQSHCENQRAQSKKIWWAESA